MSADKIFPNFEYRQDIVKDINKILRESNSEINGYDMEYQFAAKARNKDEYLSFVARFLLQVKNGDPATVQEGSTQCIKAMADSSNAIGKLEKQDISSNYTQVMSSCQQSAPISNESNVSSGIMVSVPNNSVENGTNEIKENPELCCICLDNNANTVLIPCGHLTLCYDCALVQRREEQNNCPICRFNVYSFIKIYKP